MKKHLYQRINLATKINLLFIVTVLLPLVFAHSAAANTNSNKVLFVVSSHEYGYWAAELIEPYSILTNAGYQITIASPKGGKNPVAGVNRMSGEAANVFNQEHVQKILSQTIPLSEIKSVDFKAVYYVGGAGPMFDLLDDPYVDKITREIFENNGVVAADCHGPAALLNVRLSDGRLLVANKKLTAKANAEEGNWARENYPFLLEDKFKELGAQFSAGASWTSHVVVDGNLITGQNPQSAIDMAHAMVKVLENKNANK